MNIIEQSQSPWKRILRWIIMVLVVSALSFFINQCSAGDTALDASNALACMHAIV